MSVEQTDIIDGLGVAADGAVEMLISDHLEWDNERHLEQLATKIEAYAGVIISGQLAEIYPAAEGRAVRIKLVWQHVPTAAAARVFETLEAQLRNVGIGFTQTALPSDY